MSNLSVGISREIQSQSQADLLAAKTSLLQSLREFSRPHTILGTTLGVTTAWLTAWRFHGFPDTTVLAPFAVWLSWIAVNIYVVGINQVVDLELDQMNKPYLPLASGALQRRTGLWLSVGCAIAAFVFAALLSKVLFIAIALVFCAGTAYSLPPFHLKGSPLGAALAIAISRGLALNIGTFLHFNEMFGGSLSLPPHVLVFSTFIFGFCLVIALLKDIPDIEGDRQHGISTLAVRIGPRVVFQIARTLLALCYVGMIAAGIYGGMPFNRMFFTIAHLILLAIFWMATRSVDPSDHKAFFKDYMVIWKFFYAEFVVFTIACYIP